MGIECDCCKIKREDAWDVPEWISLCLGGSDFERSFGQFPVYHFCSVSCLKESVEDLYFEGRSRDGG